MGFLQPFFLEDFDFVSDAEVDDLLSKSSMITETTGGVGTFKPFRMVLLVDKAGEVEAELIGRNGEPTDIGSKL